MAALRAYRLGRVRDQLKQRDLGACVLIDPINTRYATGYRTGAMYKMHIIPSSYVFIPVEGPVIMFDAHYYENIARDLETIAEFRPALNLTFWFAGPRVEDMLLRWADEIVDLIEQYGNGNKRLAIDPCDLRVAATFAKHGIEVHDAEEPLELARSIKSAEEIACINYSIAVAEVALARMREALSPGMTENEVWSILHQTNIAAGGEWIDARLLASGDRTNPWFQETCNRVIRPGELVGTDTDMVGPFGYCADISRTFRCGPGKPTNAQRNLYKLAYEELHHNIDLIKPGMNFRELSEKAWKQPDEYAVNRYAVLAHGIGMCDEYPAIFHWQDWDQDGYDGIIEEGMTLCMESYIGAEGGDQGVKLEDMVLVTKNGVEVLSKFPFEDEFLT